MEYTIESLFLKLFNEVDGVLKAYLQGLTYCLLFIILTYVRTLEYGDTMKNDEFFNYLAIIGKALDSPERLRMLDALCQSERSVESLSDHLEMNVGTVSHHLQKLKAAGMVSVRRDGRFSFYSVSCSGVFGLLRSMKALSSEVLPGIKLHVADLNRSRHFFVAPEGRTLPGMIESGEVTVVDVRSAEEYDSAHLPGALSMPLNCLDDRMSSLPPDSTVLAYCSDLYCDHADKAVEILREAGFKALLLNDSVSERISSGSEVEITC